MAARSEHLPACLSSDRISRQAPLIATLNELTLQIANILAPGVLLATIGLAWFYKGPEYPVGFITTLILNVGAPALLFHTLSTSVIPVSSLGVMAVATVCVHVSLVGIAWPILKMAGRQKHLSIAFAVGNTGNMGLPICFFAFGPEGLAYAMTFFAVQSLLLFSLGDVIYAGSFNVKRLLQSPILHAIWLGVLVNTTGYAVPAALMQASELLGQVVIPVMLITLGYSLAGMRVNQLPVCTFWSLVRTLLAFTVGFSIANLLGMQGVARAVLVLQTVAPIAVFNYLLSVKHGHDTREISGMILMTHLAAMIYLPMVLAAVL